MGLLSPGGVHSHEAHIFAMLELAIARACRGSRCMPSWTAATRRRVRPSQPARLQALCDKLGNARIATVGGRYYAMDRDKRWDRVRRGWDADRRGQSEHRATDALSALQAAYARGENDEFVAPTVIDGAQPMRDGDAVVFMNFRADRARQLTAAFVDPGFDGFRTARAVPRCRASSA
jgi:2,3-bisphosphoglycerate-independent phosphoglycerate mutase